MIFKVLNLSLYNDIRDFFLEFHKESHHEFFPNFEKKNIQVKFVLLNNVKHKFNDINSSTIKYIKLSQIIPNQDAFVYEFLNLKKNHTLVISLDKIKDNQNFHITYISSDMKIYTQNLSLLSNKILHQEPNILHFHFRNKNINEIEIYKTKCYSIKIIILFLIFIIIAFFLLFFCYLFEFSG